MSDHIDTGAGWQADDSPADSPAEASPPASPAMMPAQRPEPSQPAPEPQQAPADEGDDSTAHDLHKARQIRSENHNLRTRLRDTEAERDGLRAVADGLRRGEVERLAAAELQDARDLLDRHDVSEFLDDSGHVDPAKVSAAARALIADRPHTAAPPVVTAPPSNRPIESLTAGASPTRKPDATTWHGALGPLVR